MTTASSADNSHSRLYLLALGLVVGFVTGFVVLLASLPVDSTGLDHRERTLLDAERGAGYDFHEILVGAAEPTVTSDTPQEPIATIPASMRAPAPTAPMIRPATRVVPGDAIELDRSYLPEQSYDAIPVEQVGREHFYLQSGGTFRDPAEAEQRRAAVLLTGLDAKIVAYEEAHGGLGYRVRIGPFPDNGERFFDAMYRLRDASLGYQIVRVSG